MDVVVERMLVLELKMYLKLSGIRTGLLMNFHTPVLKDGIRRLVL